MNKVAKSCKVDIKLVVDWKASDIKQNGNMFLKDSLKKNTHPWFWKAWNVLHYNRIIEFPVNQNKLKSLLKVHTKESKYLSNEVLQT